MSDVIEPASSGRAKCRGCGRPIRAQELRFGEALPNPYAEGETRYWFHLACAACMRPEKLLSALDVAECDVPDEVWLRETASVGLRYPRLGRLARVERAASGRARCRHCRELVEKGQWRLALHIFEDGRFNPIGTIHIECAEGYFGAADVLERLRRIQDLEEAWVPELEEALRSQRRGATEPPAEEARDAAGADATRLAKTHPPVEPSEAAGTRRSS